MKNNRLIMSMLHKFLKNFLAIFSQQISIIYLVNFSLSTKLKKIYRSKFIVFSDSATIKSIIKQQFHLLNPSPPLYLCRYHFHMKCQSKCQFLWNDIFNCFFILKSVIVNAEIMGCVMFKTRSPPFNFNPIFAVLKFC